MVQRYEYHFDSFEEPRLGADGNPDESRATGAKSAGAARQGRIVEGFRMDRGAGISGGNRPEGWSPDRPFVALFLKMFALYVALLFP
jgi:hypothetical protein